MHQKEWEIQQLQQQKCPFVLHRRKIALWVLMNNMNVRSDDIIFV